MKNILIDIQVNEEALERLKAMPDVTVETVGPNIDEETRWLPPEVLKDKNIFFCSVLPENFKDMASLELIQLDTAGYSQLYDYRLPEKGVRACNAAGLFDVPIAEWNISMMVNLARDIRGMIRNQESGIWESSGRFQNEIHGSILGIWGYGSIGRETARLAKSMGMKIYVLDKSSSFTASRTNIYRVPGTGDPDGSLPDRIFNPGQEKEFLKELDFLIFSMPLTKNTRGIAGEDELRALPSKAYILNPARGPLIREEALLKALREGWIAGAALDTHYYYPMPADHPLWRLPNVIMTPHISGSSFCTNYKQRVWDIFLQNTVRFINGQPLLNELTKEQLDGE